MLRASWKAWIEAEVNEGRNHNEAEELAILFQLCKVFEMTPEQFGIVMWPGGTKVMGSTYKTGVILSNLVLALICERIENPPIKHGAVTELLKTLPAGVKPV
jgi:hypothetical protein